MCRFGILALVLMGRLASFGLYCIMLMSFFIIVFVSHIHRFRRFLVNECPGAWTCHHFLCGLEQHCILKSTERCHMKKSGVLFTGWPICVSIGVVGFID